MIAVAAILSTSQYPLMYLAFQIQYLMCVHVQMSGWQGAQSLHAEGSSAVAYTGMMDCLARTVKEEGVRALFKVHPAASSLPLESMYVCMYVCGCTCSCKGQIYTR